MSEEKTKRSKWIYLYIFLAGMVTCFVALTYQSDDDRRVKIIELVLNNPDLFPLGFETDLSARAYYKDYVNMSKDLMTKSKHYKDTRTVEAAKEKALTKAMEILTVDFQRTADLRSTYGPVLTIHLGGIDKNNFIQMHVVRKSAFTVPELEMYVQNIKTILDAIPPNIPGRSELTKFPLAEVRFFETYAKVKFARDKAIERFEETNAVYRGQF